MSERSELQQHGACSPRSGEPLIGATWIEVLASDLKEVMVRQ